MKKFKLLFAFVAIAGLAVTGCSSDDDSDAVPPGPSPAGAGELVAQVDGVEFRSISAGTTARITGGGGIETLNITAVNLGGEAMTLQITDSPLMEASYNMDPANNITVVGTYTRINTTTFQSTSYTAPYMNSGDVGTVTITELTATNVKGTFEFTPADQSDRTNTVSITAGSFDLPLQ